MALSSGQHLVVDLYGCDPDLLWDKAYMSRLLNELPSKIGMTLIKKAVVIEYHPKDNLVKWIKRILGLVDNDIDSGLTGFSILAESHISFHNFPERDGFTYFDVLSCKEFDKDVVINYLTEMLDPESSPHAVLKRGSDFGN